MNTYELADKLTGDVDKDIEMLGAMMLAERDRDAKRIIIEMLDRINDYAHLAESGLRPSGIEYRDFATGDLLFEMPSDDAIATLADAKKKADEGDADAQYRLAMYILSGILGFPDYREVATLLTKAAESGSSAALYELAVCYTNGEGVPHDFKKAEECYLGAVELGNVDAMIALGAAYRGGKGLPENPKGSYEMYKAAAECGCAAGYLHMGICLFNGTGVEADIEKAIESVKTAEKLGSPDAKMLLKRMQRYYEEGDLDAAEIAARD